jgi:hypothetical protein
MVSRYDPPSTIEVVPSYSGDVSDLGRFGVCRLARSVDVGDLYGRTLDT